MGHPCDLKLGKWAHIEGVVGTLLDELLRKVRDVYILAALHDGPWCAPRHAGAGPSSVRVCSRVSVHGITGKFYLAAPTLA